MFSRAAVLCRCEREGTFWAPPTPSSEQQMFFFYGELTRIALVWGNWWCAGNICREWESKRRLRMSSGGSNRTRLQLEKRLPQPLNWESVNKADWKVWITSQTSKQKGVVKFEYVDIRVDLKFTNHTSKSRKAIIDKKLTVKQFLFNSESA